MPAPTLELSMIVKNGAAGLARCLAGVRGIVNRITIGNTGSDDTSRIAREFGANVLSIAWQDDFAAARNAVLANATCDWVLFLDADEMLDPAAASWLPGMLADPAVAAYEITAWNYVSDAGFRSSGEQARPNPGLIPETRPYPFYFPSCNTRLFRRHPGIYFKHCVHETVADCIDALGLRRVPGDFIIHHFGYAEDAEERRSGKEQLYYELALKKLACSPKNYQANFGAGMAELDHAKQPTAALPYFEKASALYPDRAPSRLYLGICLTRLGRHAEALPHVQRAISLDPANMLAASTLGDIYFQTGDHRNAREAYGRAMELGDRSPLSLVKLGAAKIHLGDRESGIACMKEAIRRNPDTAELYDIYAPAAFLGGYHAVACEAAEHRLSMKNVSAFNFLLAGTLHLHSNMRGKAKAIVQAGIRRFPDDGELNIMMTSLNRTAS